MQSTEDSPVEPKACITKQTVSLCSQTGHTTNTRPCVEQVIAYLAKRSGERHWHIAAPLLVAACAMTLMPLVEQYVTWLSFLALVVGAVGIWGPHGPLLSWPAALLPGTAAASGRADAKP